MESIIEKPKPRSNRCPHCGKFIKLQQPKGSLALRIALIGIGLAAGIALGYFLSSKPAPFTNLIDRLI